MEPLDEIIKLAGGKYELTETQLQAVLDAYSKIEKAPEIEVKEKKQGYNGWVRVIEDLNPDNNKDRATVSKGRYAVTYKQEEKEYTILRGPSLSNQYLTRGVMQDLFNRGLIKPIEA